MSEIRSGTPHPFTHRLASASRPTLPAAFVAIVGIASFVLTMTDPLAALVDGVPTILGGVPVIAVAAVVGVACLVQAALLLLSSRWPSATALLTLACYLAVFATVAVPSWLTSMQFVVGIALFLLGARGSARRAVTVFAAAVVVDVIVIVAWALAVGGALGATLGFITSATATFAVIAAGGTALGVWWGAQQRRLEDSRERIARDRTDHDALLAAARERERIRIAEELHDVAAQHLAGLLSLADAAVALSDRRPDDARALIPDIRAEGRFAAASLYGALDELRRGIDETPAGSSEGARAESSGATPDLRRLETLVTMWRRRGMPCELFMLGDVSELPAIVSLTAYRGIQEALTNAAKHAPGAPVRVEVVTDPASLTATVDNGATRSSARDDVPIGLGWGLAGLRTRLSLVDATLHAAPFGDGWRVRMRFPLESG